MPHIQVNLTYDLGSYERGNGEGVWVIVDDFVKAAYDNDESGTTYEGILDNDSCYFPSLFHGVVIPFEMRGEKRPVVPYTWLIEHYGEAENRGFALHEADSAAGGLWSVKVVVPVAEEGTGTVNAVMEWHGSELEMTALFEKMAENEPLSTEVLVTLLDSSGTPVRTI